MTNYINNRYYIMKKISQNSSTSAVYKCRDEDTDNIVAIKILNKNTTDNDSNTLENIIFKREVSILKSIQHPNIIKLIDFGEEARLNKHYIVLEYINGLNLEKFLQKYTDISEEQKINLFDQICLGIEYLHKKKILHRDIKPSNIMIDDNFNIKIIDFGISKLYDTYSDDMTIANFNTPRYCSPEQDTNSTITVQSDIYSLGLVCYEIFSGISYKKNHALQLENLSIDIKNIIQKMTQTIPSDRYKTIKEIRDSFYAIQNKFLKIKIIQLGITNNAVDKLYQYNYINEVNRSLAIKIANKDLNDKVYILTKNNSLTEQFWIIGKEITFICSRNKRNQERFTITSIKYFSTEILMDKKEIAFEIKYNIQVKDSLSNTLLNNEISATNLIAELRAFENKYLLQKDIEQKNKETVNKWKDFLTLQRKALESEKYSLEYNSFKKIENGDCIEVYLKGETFPEDIKFGAEDMLQMTSKEKRTYKYDVGFIRDYSDGKLIIDLIADLDTNNIAQNGTISINKNMIEIALNRQEQALKMIRFKESINPEISNIILDPKTATSKDNILLSSSDFHSKYIDSSKKESLEKALSSDNIFLLQGPPGTGKTTFISELVCQIVDRNPQAKILITSQSHVAVDHSLTKIKELLPSIKLIRIGRKEKFSEKTIDFTLEKFCHEWTQSVILRCKQALKNYKSKINLDEDIEYKNSIIMEIDSLLSDVLYLENELQSIKKEQQQFNVLGTKWNRLKDIIINMSTNIKNKTNYIVDDDLLSIIDSFSIELTNLNNKLENILNESIDISLKQEKLNAQSIEIQNKIQSNQKDIIEWKRTLGISPEKDEEYLNYKNTIQELLKENKEKYTHFGKIKSLCDEWIKKVQQGDGLLEQSVLDTTIIGATCLGISSLSNKINLDFDWVIIDEAGKSTPTEILVPICLGKKIILVGDHKQLPPIIDEKIFDEETDLTKSDMEISLFEYMEKSLPSNCKHILNEQYRMHPIIGELISTMFYRETGLISKTTKEEKTIPLKLYQGKSLIWLSTSKQTNNTEEQIGFTYQNSCEAKIVFKQLLLIDKELQQLHLQKDVAIIAGYKAQIVLFKRMYMSEYINRFTNINLEINTVDAFQGRETDIVFYSVVRSNIKGNMGFLKDMRRLNVALSRARELLIIVGNQYNAIKNKQISQQENPFCGIVQFIIEHDNDCMLKEI